MVAENLPIVEKWSRAGGIIRTRKSGLRDDSAAASIMSRGCRNCSIEGICSFPSFSLKYAFSPATSATFGGSGCSNGGG